MGCLSSRPREGEKSPLISSQNPNQESTKAKAVRDYTAKKSSEITFITGDVLDIIDKTQKEYWMGQVDGQTIFGWFPSVCVVLIDEKEAIFLLEKRRITAEQNRKGPSSEEVQSAGPRHSVTVNTAGKAVRVRAKQDYTPDSNATRSGIIDGSANAISFKKGDFLVVTDKSRSDWWLGHIEGSTQWGWFPANCVELT